MTFDNNILEELSTSIEKRVIEHKNNIYRILKNRYYSILPTLITYSVGNKTDIKNNINFYRLEKLLRQYNNAVIGLDKFNNLAVLGISTSVNYDLFNQSDKISIKFLNDITPKKDYKLITSIDGYNSGNCIVIYNNQNNNIDDYTIINHYVTELTEISLSRFSTILQSKINTFFRGNVNDESINKIVTDLYNGCPYIKVSNLFDVDEQIITLDNKSSELLLALKNEYNNKLSELNNILGINTSYKDKESGMSNSELNGNINYVNANANIYLISRNEEFFKLYKRFGIKIVAKFREVQKDEIHNNVN